MKFDAIIGNPPFQAPEKNGAPLWKKFINLSLPLLKPGGYLCFISPDTWLTDKTIGPVMKTYDIQYVNLKLRSYFTTKIQSTFSFFLINNSPYSGNTEMEAVTETFNTDFNTVLDFPSRNISSITIKIFNKFYSIKKKFEPVSVRDNFSKEKTTIYKYPAYHTRAQPLVYVKTDEYINQKKVIFPTASKFEVFYDNGNLAIATLARASIVKDEEEGNNLLSYMQSKLFTFVQKSSKQGGWFNMKYMPKIDISHYWTDKEIYDHFGINDEEIEYIETHITYNKDLWCIVE